MPHPTRPVLALAEQIAEVVEAAGAELDEHDVLCIADTLADSPLVADHPPAEGDARERTGFIANADVRDLIRLAAIAGPSLVDPVESADWEHLYTGGLLASQGSGDDGDCFVTEAGQQLLDAVWADPAAPSVSVETDDGGAERAAGDDLVVGETVRITRGDYEGREGYYEGRCDVTDAHLVQLFGDKGPPVACDAVKSNRPSAPAADDGETGAGR